MNETIDEVIDQSAKDFAERFSGKSQTTGSVSNSEYAKNSARRAAESDYDYDKQKRRVGKNDSAYQAWHDQRWSELEKQND